MPGSAPTTVSETVATRTAIRAFLPKAVPETLIREILSKAGRAPSGGNLQPWRVHALSGAPLTALKEAARANPAGETPAYAIYPEPLWEPLRSRRRECGEDLYATINISRSDRAQKLAQLQRNGVLFDAPVGLFFLIDRRCGPPQWADVGMLMQNVMLLAIEAGLATCPQEYWAQYPATLKRLLGHDDDHMVFAGMALGHADPAAPINTLRTRRDPLESWCVFQGFATE